MRTVPGPGGQPALRRVSWNDGGMSGEDGRSSEGHPRAAEGAGGATGTGGTTGTGEDMGAEQDWTRQRREVIQAQENALRATRQAEHEKATARIRVAIAAYRDAGIAPVPLQARPYTGTGSIRTSLTGWYLKHDRSLAIDEEGRFYVMRVPGGILSRLRGATPEPSLAPMVVGRGARDGETFDIDELLQMRLEDPVRP